MQNIVAAEKIREAALHRKESQQKHREHSEVAFQEACERYRETLYNMVADATTWMNSKHFDSYRMTTLSQHIVSGREEVKGKNFPVHVLHYGKNDPRNRSWQRRLPFDGLSPFQQVQQELFYEKGLYLLDLSDPARSYHIVIGLYAYPPHAEMGNELWHGLNQVPMLEDDDNDGVIECGGDCACLEGCED